MPNLITASPILFDYMPSGTAVSNTLLESSLGVNFTIPLRFFYTGRCFKYVLRGMGSSISGVPGQLTLNTYLNSTLLCTTGPLNLTSGATNYGFEYIIDGICITGHIGSTSGNEPNSQGPVIQADCSIGGLQIPGTTTVQPAIADPYILKTTAIFTVANAGNSVQARQASIMGMG
ncbi:MAG TPA: hypothetical protein VKR58_05820 [Aquella sp.]|nr:hypothetical protein [Aquella sp.]